MEQNSGFEPPPAPLLALCYRYTNLAYPQPELHRGRLMGVSPAEPLLRGAAYKQKGDDLTQSSNTKWHRLIDSHYHQRFQRPLCCYYTKPI